MTALLWLTRDLRLHDHPALRAALDDHECVVPVFCLDDRLLHGRHASGPRTQFLLDCLTDLDGSLRLRGSGLVIRHGAPERELPALAAEVGAQARLRDRRQRSRSRVAAPSGYGGRSATCSCDRGRACTPSTTSAPCAPSRTSPTRSSARFIARWLGMPRRAVLGAPRTLPTLPSGLRKGQLPSLDALGLEQELEQPPRGGETAGARAPVGLPETRTCTPTPTTTTRSAGTARRACRRTCTSAASRCARSSSGCRAERGRTPSGASSAGATSTRTCCCTTRATRARSSRIATAARSGGADAKRPFEAWCEGRTGFPLVDAGMRQLQAGGLDAQPRAAGRGLVPDQGPRHRLALGRALVHAPAGGRRRGQQQRQLAVDRLGRRRSSARLPAHLQPGAARWRRSTRRASTYAVTSPSCATCRTRTCASRGRCPRTCSARSAA